MNKLIIIFLFSFLYFFVYPQNIDTLRITGSYTNISIKNFLNELEKELSVNFYFKDEWFEDEIISLSYSNTLLSNILSKAIEGKPYIFQAIQDNMIIFLPKEKVAFIVGDMIDLSEDMTDLGMIVIGDPNEAGKYKEVELKGYVKDGKTRESLIGATIQIENTTQGVITNLKGEYSLILKPGIYTLIISSIGYEKSVYKVKIISSGKLDIDLFEESLKIDEIAIYAQRADKNVRSSQMSIIELDARSIKQLPSITGDKDILKSLTMMPGVKSVGEFGSGINVRGGGEDQNLYLIEGAPVFNTSHVFGLLSVINPDAVNNLTLYKGHIPAGYGERVSSIMDIQIQDNNSKKLGSKGGIGLYNSRLMIEGPIYKDKLTFKIGGRTSYSDFLLTRIPDYYLQNSSASFYDFNGLLNLSIKNNRFALFGYNSYDKFKYASDLAYEYENRLLSLSWAHFFNSNIGFNFLASASQYNVTKDDLIPEYEEKRIKSQIQYSSIKYNLTYSGIAKNTFDAGIQSIYYFIKPGNQSPLNDSSLIPHEVLMNEQAFENSVYINDIYDINDHISINAGLRYSRYDYIGPRTINQYIENAPISLNSFKDSSIYNKGEIIQSYQGIEPRFSIKIQYNDHSSLKLSYNRNFQYISLISYTAISTPDDVWKLSDPYLKPIQANQFAIGHFRNFMDNTIETSVEVYYKVLENLLEYKNGAQINMNNSIETELINASGKNYGIEFLFKKNKGRVDGWISYTYSRAFVKTHGQFLEEVINNNNYYSSSYDKPHDLTILATYHINRRWRITGNFRFASGRSVTLPEYKFRGLREEIIFYSERNKYRLPPYHRLDLSVSIDESLRIKKKWKGSWTFSILNVYARKNAYSVFYKKEKPDLQNDFQGFALYKLYIIGKPLPTITYNFIF